MTCPFGYGTEAGQRGRIRTPYREQPAREHSPAAVARHPDMLIIAAGVELAASPVLLEEGVQVKKQSGHRSWPLACLSPPLLLLAQPLLSE